MESRIDTNEINSLPVLKVELLGGLVQLSPRAVMLKLYGCPQCRSARVQLFTEVLWFTTCPSIPVAVTRWDVATGECPHVTVAPFSSHDATTVTLTGAQGAKEDRITLNICLCLYIYIPISCEIYHASFLMSFLNKTSND